MILTKLIIETKSKRNYKKRLLNTFTTLNTKYDSKTFICEGYVNNQRFLQGNFEVAQSTKVRTYRNTCPAFFDLTIDNATKYKMLDHYDATRRNRALRRRMGIHRTALLHGAPGTGKSTLCTAVAHKIRLRSRTAIDVKVLHCAQYVSKFFGESSRKLEAFFAGLKRDIVIVDKAESLVFSRERVSDRSEPLDSMRIVNTFLVGLDRSDSFFLFSTNLLGVVDGALVDRMDVVVRLARPDTAHVYRLLTGILQDLMMRNELVFENVPEYKTGGHRLVGVSDGLLGLSVRRIKKIVFSAIGRNVRTVDDLLARIEGICRETA